MARPSQSLPLPRAPLPEPQASLDLALTLQLVADTIVESLGFDVAVINIIDDDETLVVAAVCGPESVRAALLHQRQGREGWATLLAHSEPWGRLRFLDHRTAPADPTDLLMWIPDLPLSTDPLAWHPLDALFALLEATDGRLLGILSVDVPRDGRRPEPATRHALEAFAVAASLAIEHATLAALSRSSALRFQSIFDKSPVAIGLLGADGTFQQANAGLCAFLDRPHRELIGASPSSFAHPDDAAALAGDVDRLRAGGSPEATTPRESRYRRPDQRCVWGRSHLAWLDEGAQPELVILQIEDVTARKGTEQRLEQQASVDSLTGLPNRSQSLRALRAALDADAAAGTITAVFFCDLDRLKLVNDAHGHAAGDGYLRAVSQRIRSAVRDSDTVGRLSGDEFIVVLSGLSWPAEALGLAGRVIDAVRAPLTLGGVAFTPSLSLGIAYNDGTLTADELVAQADSAMYHAKTEDRGSWHVYDPSLRNSAASHLALRAEVSRALARGELVVHYQPIVRLADRAVLGHEALLRWQHPTRGLLTPAQFLDVIIDSEFEAPVTDWVMRQACLDAARRPAGGRRVSVNVSSQQVGRRDLPDVVTRCLQESGLAPRELVLELTEDRLLARPDGPELLARLRDVGVRLAIDDFGTGFAGLGYLQRLSAITVIKLDRSFVAGLGEDEVSGHIVRAVVELTQRCGHILVTEGVETEAQARMLTALGVRFAQGYLFGRPAPTPARP